jgi:hypothetical protein
MLVAAACIAVLLSFPAHDLLRWLAYYGASAVAVYIALRLARDDNQQGPSLAGERWATRDALRAYQRGTWPQPAPYVTAGIWWEEQPRGRPRPIVYGVEAAPRVGTRS